MHAGSGTVFVGSWWGWGGGECVCVCVREREREMCVCERERGGGTCITPPLFESAGFVSLSGGGKATDFSLAASGTKSVTLVQCKSVELDQVELYNISFPPTPPVSLFHPPPVLPPLLPSLILPPPPPPHDYYVYSPNP